MVELTYRAFQKALEEHNEGIDYLDKALRSQGCTPGTQVVEGDVFHKIINGIFAKRSGGIPLAQTGIYWKKPVGRNGPDLLLCVMGAGTPDPQPASMVDYVDYKEFFDALPNPPNIQLYLFVLPEDIETTYDPGREQKNADVIFDDLDDFLTSFTSHSPNDPTQAPDILSIFSPVSSTPTEEVADDGQIKNKEIIEQFSDQARSHTSHIRMALRSICSGVSRLKNSIRAKLGR